MDTTNSNQKKTHTHKRKIDQRSTHTERLPYSKFKCGRHSMQWNNHKRKMRLYLLCLLLSAGTKK